MISYRFLFDATNIISYRFLNDATGDNSFIPLNKNFPIDEWVKQYGENKWRGHVFCPPDDKLREKVYRASKKVLEEKLGIMFNNFAYKLSKIPHSSDINN